MKNSTVTIVTLFASIVILFVLGSYIIDTRAVPSFSEYMASSTYTSATTSSSLGLDSILEKISGGSITVKTPNGTVGAEIANTDDTLSRGLGGRNSMPEGRGMLFVFSGEDKYTFWMKDMLFPLDIIWIDAGGNVVGIDKNVSPKTYPKTFAPPVPILYVLELNANEADKLGIAKGVKLEF